MSPNSSQSPDELLRQIGVVDLTDGETYVARNSARSLMVRGVRSGGSPVLDVLTRFVPLLLLILVVGLVLGGIRLVKGSSGPDGGGVPAASRVDAGEFVCKPSWWRRPPVAASIQESPGILFGAVSMPREPDVLQEIGAVTRVVDGDRVDQFSPQGGQLAIRYTGSGLAVRSVTARLDEPMVLCRALEAVGVVTASLRVSLLPDGRVHAVDPEPSEFFRQGGELFVQGTADAVQVVHLQRR